MKTLASIILTAALASAADYPSLANSEIEVYVFGKSHHTSGDGWNEDNYGLGVGIAIPESDHMDITFTVGTYKDSYGETAKFALVGGRYIWGDRDGANASLGIAGGYYDGSGFKPMGFLPVFSIGYDWVSICVTGNPSFRYGYKDGTSGEAASIAGFLKFSIPLK